MRRFGDTALVDCTRGLLRGDGLPSAGGDLRGDTGLAEDKRGGDGASEGAEVGAIAGRVV